MAVFTYGRAWPRRQRPACERVSTVLWTAMVVAVLAAPLAWLWRPLGVAVACVALPVAFAARCAADRRR